MQIGDIIEVGLVTELAGVPMANVLYYQVADPTLTTTLEAALLEIATAFNSALGLTRSSSAVLTCATWNNRNGNDPFAQTFFNIPGGGAGNALPTQSAVRVTRYAAVAGVLHFGGIYVAGIVEASVDRGRLINAGELSTVESWLSSNLVLAAGPTLENGFLTGTGGPTPTNVFVSTDKARTNPQVRSLTRRQSRLCGA